MISVPRQTGGKLDDVQTGLNNIEAILDQLEVDLHGLEGAWDGDAKIAFAEASRRAQHQMRVLGSIAATGRRFAQSHIDNVDTFDTKRASAWTR